MSAQERCPICGEGHVAAQVQMAENEYKGHKADLPLHYKQCDTCTSDFAGAAESKLNRRELMAFRKRVDGLLTGDEITALRNRHGLTQTQAAQLFGGGPVAFSKYENDDVAQSEAMDNLLRLVRRSPAAFWELVQEKGMQAEFTQQRAPVHAGVYTDAKVISITVARTDANRFDPRYDPLPYRRFEQGTATCRT